MFRCLKRIITHYKIRNGMAHASHVKEEQNAAFLSHSLKKNIARLKEVFGEYSDVSFREFSFGRGGRMRGALVLIAGLVNREIIDIGVMQPLMSGAVNLRDADGDIDAVYRVLIPCCQVKKLPSMAALVDSVMSGDTLFLLDGSNEALTITAKHWDKRAIEEPATENVVRGPREGYGNA